MGITEIITGQQQEKLNWGDGLGLFDVARNKIIGLATLAIYYQQAGDKELKALIKHGAEKIAIPHIDRIQKLLKEESQSFPKEIAYKDKLSLDIPGLKPNTLISDDEIAASVQELTRLTLTLESEAMRNACRKDVRDMLTSIFNDDNNVYNSIMNLQKSKKWDNAPPNLIH